MNLAYSSGVLDPHGPVGEATRLILLDATLVMLGVVVPVIVLTLAFAWWFRSGNRHARRRPDWTYSGRVEFVTWSIPALVVMFLGGIAWIGSHDLEPSRPLPVPEGRQVLQVQVISLDWKWLFIYPRQQVASVNQLVLPTGTPVHFQLTSASVMNSFFIPQLGGQIYTMYGMTTQLHLQADDAGDYAGISAQFSGDGFSDMRFVASAVTDDEFEAWVADARRSGPRLDHEAYMRLATPSRADPVSSFGTIDPRLFAHVAAAGTAMHGDHH